MVDGSQLQERGRELDAIASALDAARAGDGGALLIAGPRGIGASSLLDAAVGRARARDLRVLVASAARGDAATPLGVARRLLAPVLQARAPTMPDGDGAVRALAGTVADAVAREPLLLAVDDLDAADAGTLGLALLLARWLRGRPGLLVAVVRRPAATVSELALDELSSGALAVLRPRPLRPTAVAALLARELAAPVAPVFAAAVAEATGGMPASVVELAAVLAQSGIAPSQEHAATAAETARALHARALRAQVEALDGAAPAAPVAAVAEAVALLDDAATPARVARLARLTLGDAQAALDRLAGAELLRSADPPRFARRRDHEALVDALALVRRARLRGRAAALLAGDGAAVAAGVQLLDMPRADPGAPSDPAHADILGAAAGEALEDGRPELAVELLRRLLAEPLSPAERTRARVELGKAQAHLGRPEGVATLRRALDEATDPPEIADAAAALGWALAGVEGGSAAQVLDDARVRVEGAERAVAIDTQIAETSTWDVRLWPARRQALERLERAAGWSPLARAARTAADATDAVAACRPADEVVELCQRALADGVLADSPPHGVSTALTLSMMLGYAGRPDLGGDQIAHVVARLHARRVRLFLRPAVAMRGALALMAGRLLDAERDLRAAFDEDAPRELAPWRMQSAPLMTGFLVVCQLARGDLDGAAATVEESDLDIVLQDILPNAFFLFARAELRRARGDLHGALGDLRMCGRRLQAGNWENPAIAPWRGTAARVLMELGDVEQARALTAAELRFARAAGVPSVLARALRDRAAVLEPAAARGLLEESVALASASPLEHAESLTDLGALVLDGGALEGARDLLRDGLTVARATGAEPLARRAAALLHTAGGRPRRTNGIGLDVLTAAERRVAVLAGEGRTNREIAEQLVVSLKTVETHLRSAYRKLGIGSRAQLPEAIADAS